MTYNQDAFENKESAKIIGSKFLSKVFYSSKAFHSRCKVLIKVHNNLSSLPTLFDFNYLYYYTDQKRSKLRPLK